ncbi:MAG: bifunctional (p)ppGpp synthetase/guanosine-3',5'-bis(diphosphate) 3'-pyrophosphohydrolase [Spirochaetes bacterium]|nr:bifunctional (p)ppGpp synthetase/guanosine-3',5'-bis(diphosphate) 3'-pyrophosphohydrolase [Spirochaetota bacterium]
MGEIELKIKERDFNTLLEILKKNRPDADIPLITAAYEYAENAHKNQKRLSGEPYIIHPLEVAIILAKLKMDTPTIIAALLHDVVEDTETSLPKIASNFGENIAELVDGVTKISSLKKKTKYHDQAQTLRKMLMATIKDARVIIIKLADKTHNMRTLMFQPAAKQKKIATEVLDIYAPLAGRLGMSKIRSELEDLAFHVLYPQDYEDLKKHFSLRRDEIEAYIEFISEELHKELKKNNLEAEITGRVKHFYSIYRKMKYQDKTFEDIFDIRAIRIIAKEVKDCYAILGTVHTLWPPVPSRFKDYIAVPKSNMYQSLHTTVTGPDKHFLEIQIRTIEMDLTADMGIAAHWSYKENVNLKDSIPKQSGLALLKDITKWREEVNDTREFMTELKMDLYEEEIFVFTPKGKIIKLGKGATPIDFAYSIHTEVGHHCSGAKVNNSMVPLRTTLNSGDIVEITTNPNHHPNDTWLKIVKSSNARTKIKTWLRKHHSEMDSDFKKEEKARKSKKEKTAEVSIPDTDLIKIHQYNRKNKTGITVEGDSNVLIKLSQCCQPIPGDEVIGFITRGRGITVHKKSCPSIRHMKEEKERFINILWSDSEQVHPIKIAITATDRPHLFRDIADQISLMKTNIIKIEASEPQNGIATIKFVLEVKSVDHMNEIIKKLKSIKDIRDAYKINEKVILKK